MPVSTWKDDDYTIELDEEYTAQLNAIVRERYGSSGPRNATHLSALLMCLRREWAKLKIERGELEKPAEGMEINDNTIDADGDGIYFYYWYYDVAYYNDGNAYFQLGNFELCRNDITATGDGLLIQYCEYVAYENYILPFMLDETMQLEFRVYFYDEVDVWVDKIEVSPQ